MFLCDKSLLFEVEGGVFIWQDILFQDEVEYDFILKVFFRRSFYSNINFKEFCQSIKYSLRKFYFLDKFWVLDK